MRLSDYIANGGVLRIDANTTLYIATTGNDTTGDGTSGSPWLTISKAFDYLKDKWINEDISVTIQLADGTYSQSSSNLLSHPCGNRIIVTGENKYDYSMTSVQSSSGSSGSYSIILNMSSVADIAVDDYVLIHATSGGTNPEHLVGCYKVTNVDVGNTRITILSTQTVGSLSSGAVAGTVNVIKSIVSHTTNSSAFYVSNSTLSISNIVTVCTDSGAGARAYLALYNSNLNLTYCGAVGAGSNSGVYAQQASNINGSTVCISGFTYGVFAWSGVFQLTGLCVSNCVVGIYSSFISSIYAPSSIIANMTTGCTIVNNSEAILSSSKIHNCTTGVGISVNSNSTLTSTVIKDCSSIAVSVTGNGSSDAGSITISDCGNGLVAQYDSHINAPSSSVTNCSATGAYASEMSFINRNGSTFSGNGNDYSPVLNTPGNEEAYIT